jgi:hypothetical protein
VVAARQRDDDDLQSFGVPDTVVKLKELEKRLKSEPDNLGLRVQVAGLMREAGRSIEAVELYRSVALAYRDQGRTQQAIAVCRSILEIAPEDAACQGLITMLQGRGTPSRPPPAALEQPHVGPAVRAATAGTAPGTQQPQQRPASAVTPVHITEPVQVPSMPHLRQPDSVDSSSNKPADPARRSSLDETPLPRPIPYHVSDPTSQPHKISARELEEKSSAPNVTSRTGGLAEAARRISGLISSNKDSVVTGIPGIPNKEMDLAAELDTRQRPKIKSEELKKLSHPLPDPDETSPRAMEARRIANPIHDIDTRDPLLDDLATEPIEPLTPPPRSTALPSRPPKKVSIPPAGAGKTKSAPPLGTEPPIRRAPVLPSQQKPAAVGRPPLSRVPKSRDSDDELTTPRDRLSDDSDDD